MIDDGYIKFKPELSLATPPESIYTENLNKWRTILHTAKLIGVYPDGTGYGNISRRFKENTFIVSGSSTGSAPVLTSDEYVLVTDFNISHNILKSSGQIPPSSESMTHGIIYRTMPDVRCVMHVHNTMLWKTYKHVLPTTAEHIPYGTPEMAKEVKRLILTLSPHSPQIIVMGGHQDGLIVLGKSIDVVGERLLKLVS